MLYPIKRSIVWLRRMRYSRGFGVQSPWAYKFIRYVVNEHYPYYRYKQLKVQIYGLDKRTRKLCRLYFRLANYQQPESIIDFLPSSSCYKFYFIAGCKKASYFHVTDQHSPNDWYSVLSQVGEHTVLRVSLEKNYSEFLDTALNLLPSSSLIILERIKKNKDSESYWDSLIADDRVGVSFDLYYCGILFLNKDIIKQNYIVNF
ncbi:MAG: hypothetical protein K6A82_09690 [Prevotella sp.]|nr:hypothetical protein [Prevotella sp.]